MFFALQLNFYLYIMIFFATEPFTLHTADILHTACIPNAGHILHTGHSGYIFSHIICFFHSIFNDSIFAGEHIIPDTKHYCK